MADGTIDKLTISIGASSAKAVTSINKLAEAFKEMRTALSVIDSQSDQKITRLAASLNQLKNVGSLSGLKNLPTNLTNIAIAVGSISENTISRLDRLTTALQKLKGVSLRGAGSLLDKNAVESAASVSPAVSEQDSTTGATGTASGGLEAVAEKAKKTSYLLIKLKEAAARASSGLRDMGKSAQKTTGHFSSLLAAFKRIVMYRMLRSIIKEITQAFQEGLQNAYTFSQGIAGEGHRFAAAMDSMKSAGLTMKNQLGSAFIALLAAIQPIINTIISLITSLANAMSQFFSVFTGGTYLKAQDTTAQMANNMAGGAKAAKEWKNQLLGFDVINKLEAPGDTGGGGSGGLANMADAFKDTEIDGIFKKMRDALLELKDSLNFEPLIASWNHLKEAVRGFADVVGDYLAAVWEKVLVPLAHWVIEEAAPRLVELLAKAFEFLSAVLERLKPVFEWVWEHVLKPIADFVGDAFLAFLDSVIDLLGKLTDLISGKTTFKDFLESLTPGQAILLGLAAAFVVVQGAILLVNGVVSAAVTVFGLLSGAIAALASPIGLIIIALGLLTAAVILVVQHWDEIVAKFKEGLAELQGDWERTKEFFVSSAEAVKTAFSNLGESIAESFQKAMDDVRSAIERIKGTIQSVINWIKQGFESVRTAISNVFNNIRDIVASVINSIISMIQNMISVIQSALSMIGSLGGLFGGISLPHFASGGFPEDGIFMANHGELVGQFSNGKTAVANNAEITSGIASAVYDAFMAALSDASSNGGSGKQTEFVLNINGREFARAIYNDQNAVQKEYGVSYLASA